RAIDIACERLEHVPSDYSVVILDPRGCITDWRAGAQRQFGWMAEDVVGTSGSKLFALEPGDEGFAPLLARANASGIARWSGRRRRVVAASDGLQPTGAADRADQIADPRTLLIQNDPARVAEMSLAGWPDTVSSMIAVPVMYAGRIEGTIEVVGSRGRRSTEWEIAVVQAVAGRFAGRTRGERYVRADAVA